MFTLLTTTLAEPGPITWDVAKQIIQTQSNLAMVAIAALVGIAAFLLIGSWIRNNRFQKRELEKVSGFLRSEVLCEIKNDFVRLKKETNDEISKTLQDTKKSISSQLTLLEAEKARLFALVNQQTNEWAVAVGWWVTAIVESAKCKNDFLLGNGVKGLSFALNTCKKLKIPLSEEEREIIKNCFPYIPDLLESKKIEINDNLNKLSG